MLGTEDTNVNKTQETMSSLKTKARRRRHGHIPSQQSTKSVTRKTDGYMMRKKKATMNLLWGIKDGPLRMKVLKWVFWDK